MSYINKDTATITCTSSGVGSDIFTEVLNGEIYGFHILFNKGVGAGSKVEITGDSTGKRFLLVADPSTTGAFYYPRVAGCNTSGASTTLLNICQPIYNENCNIIVDAGTSAIAAGTTTVMPIATVTIYVK